MRRLQPLVDARRREERFAADAAHELRTPLGAIASVAEAARDGGAHDAAFAAIARRALDAGALVGNLLTLARKSEADALVKEPVDLAAVVAKAVAETREASPAVEIACDCNEAIVEGDEVRLLQLVRNLLSNAARFAQSRVDVKLANTDGTVTLAIEDDGPGVPPDVQSKLFERFARGSNSSGSGLGLAICRWIANAHGGSIVFDGASRFAVKIPAMSMAADSPPGA